MSGCTRYTLENDAQTSSLPPVIFTENAAKKVAALISEEDNPNLKLRVSVVPGGCSGLEYDISFDEKFNENEDEVTVAYNVTLLVNKQSFKYLSGATLDYVEDIEGERFTIDNPNAAKPCGCGASFDVKEAL